MRCTASGAFRKENPMRKLAVLGAGLAALALGLAPVAAATPAMASTATPINMTFDEPVLQDVNSSCPTLGLPDGGFCGNGIVLPYGHATETIAFSAGCGGGCDVRTVSLASGSIIMDEQASNFTCHGACGSPAPPGEPGGATLRDVIVGGTGIFASATGNLSGTVAATGLQSLVQLSGTITLAP
jgi:hypothetical protein